MVFPYRHLDDDSGRDLRKRGAEGAETLRQKDWNLTNLWKATTGFTCIEWLDNVFEKPVRGFLGCVV